MSMIVNLKVLRPLRYRTRRLLPGDIFEAPYRDARILLASRGVEKVRTPALVPPPPAELITVVSEAMPTDSNQTDPDQDV